MLLLLGVFLLAVIAISYFQPRELRISGVLGDEYYSKTAYLRLMIFDAEIAGKLVKNIEYKDVPITRDGRFELSYDTRLYSLPAKTYLQVCVNDPNSLDDWSGAVPVCTEPGEPTKPTEVKGLSSEGYKGEVSCTRREVRSGVPGFFDNLIGVRSDHIVFDGFCDEVYTETEYVTRTIQNTVNNTVSNTIRETIVEEAPPQTLSMENGLLTISQGNSVALNFLPQAEEQYLSIEGNELIISDGNSVSLPQYTPQPIALVYGAGISGSKNNVVPGSQLTLNNTGVLSVTGAGPIVVTGIQVAIIGSCLFLGNRFQPELDTRTTT